MKNRRTNVTSKQKPLGPTQLLENRGSRRTQEVKEQAKEGSTGDSKADEQGGVETAAVFRERASVQNARKIGVGDFEGGAEGQATWASKAKVMNAAQCRRGPAQGAEKEHGENFGVLYFSNFDFSVRQCRTQPSWKVSTAA